jgi:peptidoglycan/LPS O-acetylase OafA/YrhL
MYVAEQKYGMIASFVLNNNFLAGIGKISYGIYLYHYVFPGIYYGGLDYLDQQWHFNAYIMHILRNPPGAYLVQLILVLGISWASYHFFELQVIRLKRRFKYIRHSAIEQESGNG